MDWPAWYITWMCVIHGPLLTSACMYDFKFAISENSNVPKDDPRLRVKMDEGLECLAFCTNAGAYVSVIYVPTSTSCMCYFTPLPSMTLSDVRGAVAYTLEDVGYAEYWISRIVDYSSEYDEGYTKYLASSMLGRAEIYPYYGNTNKAWCPGVRSADAFVELGIDEKVYINEIYIYEVFHGGAVRAVSIRDSNSTWVQVWATATVQHITTSRIFKPKIKLTDFSADQVRLDVDLATFRQWSEFDAVKVTGTRKPIIKRTRWSIV